MGQRGAVAPGQGGAKQHRQNILRLMITKVSIIKMPNEPKVVLSQQIIVILITSEA